MLSSRDRKFNFRTEGRVCVFCNCIFAGRCTIFVVLNKILPTLDLFDLNYVKFMYFCVCACIKHFVNYLFFVQFYQPKYVLCNPVYVDSKCVVGRSCSQLLWFSGSALPSPACPELAEQLVSSYVNANVINFALFSNACIGKVFFERCRAHLIVSCSFIGIIKRVLHLFRSLFISDTIYLCNFF